MTPNLNPSRAQKILNAAWRLAIGTSALTVTLLLAACGPRSAPSDDSIIARFNAHRAEFSRLLRMFHQDEIIGRSSCDDPPNTQGDRQRLHRVLRLWQAKGPVLHVVHRNAICGPG